MVQTPPVSNEVVTPDMVQTVGVVEMKLTGSPELDVAVNEKLE